MANLAVPSPWGSCPQAGMFSCHSIAVRQAVWSLPGAMLLLHPTLPLAQP